MIAQRLPATDAPPAPSASSPAASRSDRTPREQIVPVTDGLVIQIMTRMRSLAREERFRAGRLR
jgi:hypothetical protein